MRVRRSTSTSNGTSAQPCSPHGRARLPSTATSGEALNTKPAGVDLDPLQIGGHGERDHHRVVGVGADVAAPPGLPAVAHVARPIGRDQRAGVGIEAVAAPFDATALLDARHLDGDAGPQRGIRDDLAVGPQSRDAAVGVAAAGARGSSGADRRRQTRCGSRVSAQSCRHDRRPLHARLRSGRRRDRGRTRRRGSRSDGCLRRSGCRRRSCAAGPPTPSRTIAQSPSAACLRVSQPSTTSPRRS